MPEIFKVSSGGKYEAMHSHSRLVMIDNWIFMSNSAGVIPSTLTFASDPVEQAKQALDNIEHALKTVGAEIADIVRLVIRIPNRRDIFPVMDHIGHRMKGIDPAMTLCCTPLGSDDYKVEIEVTAYKGAGREQVVRLSSGLFGK